MIEYLVLGVVQGIVEWLPVSSEGVLVLLQSNWLGMSLDESLHLALFLHLGTFLAALVYFWSDVVVLLRSFFSYFKQPENQKRQINFYVIATLTSGIIGFVILQLVKNLNLGKTLGGTAINLIIACLLLFTAYLQFRRQHTSKLRPLEEANAWEGFIAGCMQGLASLPGISRSGSTTSILLIRRFTDTAALKLSFLMSLPLVLVGNIALNLRLFVLSTEILVALLASFALGLLTIHGLLRIARRVNFAWFVLVFAFVLIIGTFFF